MQKPFTLYLFFCKSKDDFKLNDSFWLHRNIQQYKTIPLLALDSATYGTISSPTVSTHPIWSNGRGMLQVPSTMECQLVVLKRMSFSATVPALWYLITPEIMLLHHHHHVGLSQGPKNWIVIDPHFLDLLTIILWSSVTICFNFTLWILFIYFM